MAAKKIELTSEVDGSPVQATHYEMPFVRTELAVFSVHDQALHVLLGKRTQAPFAGRWALPGGVLRIDLDGDLQDAAQRVAQERLGTLLPNLAQVGAYGAKDRDPRAPWAMSVVYRCVLAIQSVAAHPGKRIEALKWVNADAAAADVKLAFDHAGLVASAAAAIRAEFQGLRFPPGLLSDQFTLAEFQEVSEAVLGRQLDKSSFRRRVEDAGCVEMIDGAMKTGAFRPAQLYRLRVGDSGE